jgi:transcriptional repressor NrdR
MKCPYCGSINSDVVETRDSEDLAKIRRRRECIDCKKRFTTYERVESVDVVVIKKDGRREQFDRNKLRTGIIRACYKTPVATAEIENIVNEIEQEIRNKEGIEVDSKALGKMVAEKLKPLSKVAYIRFASVYREFEDIGDFKKELKKL